MNLTLRQSDRMKTAHVFLAATILLSAGCASQKYPANFPSPLKPIVQSELNDWKCFEVFTFADDQDRWHVIASRQPSTPGDYRWIEISKTNHAVVRVIPGL